MWDPGQEKALLCRCGYGKVIEGIWLTPINLVQARKTIDALIEQGRERGYILPEHERRAAELPVSEPVSAQELSEGKGVPSRGHVDRTLGDW